jgi:catechol 2,3-dioxygenase-like lactoylglutathione lyase family enzyme
VTNPRISAVTLGVSDVSRSKQFYGDGLGCPIQQDAGQFVAFNLGDGSSSLSLYQWDALAQDAGVAPQGSGFRGVTLSYIVESAEQVDTLIAAAARAGGAVVRPAERAPWGGYSGYFADPDGYLWKVAAPSA